MNQQFECTKIKDGLYLGNIVAAHDYEFLISNKFSFIVNCTAQIPNVFQHENIRYLKFKLVNGKPHKLWDETLKKLNKLQKFLQQAEQSSLCCLVHSFHGENRSLVFIIAYLMRRYQWRLKKTLEFLKAKQIFIGLNNHYISQLEILEQILSKNTLLSSDWMPPYINHQEEIISKTFLNSLEGKQIKPPQHTNNLLKPQQQQPVIRQKKQKRIVWLDRLQKKKRKQQSVSVKKVGQEHVKMKAATHVQTVKYHIPEYDMRDMELVKNIQFNANNKRLSSSESLRAKGKEKQRSKQKQKQKQKQKDKTNPNNNDNSTKTSNMQYAHSESNNTIGSVAYQQHKKGTGYQPSHEKNIYQLTINNFISPNFNIINKTQPITKKPKRKQQKQKQKQKEKQKQKQKEKPAQSKKRPSSAGKKSTQKIVRAQSQKQVQSSGGNNKGSRESDNIIGWNNGYDDESAQTRQIVVPPRPEKQAVQISNKEKRSMMSGKQKKQVRKQADKGEKGSQGSLHSLHPLSSLAQQLIKHQQQGGAKRSSTPTRKQRKKQSRK